MLSIYRRQTWHPEGGRGELDSAPKRELYIHHSAGFFRAVDTAAQQAAIMREIDHFHHTGRGWAGIGYSYVVFQPYGRLRMARIFEGRGPDTIPAAQLGHNTGTVAVCVVDGTAGNVVKLSTKLQLIRLARKLRKEKGIQRVGGHRDAPGQSTECPGKFLEPLIGEIAKRAGLAKL